MYKAIKSFESIIANYPLTQVELTLNAVQDVLKECNTPLEREIAWMLMYRDLDLVKHASNLPPLERD